MAKRGYIPTAQELDALYNLALSGDQDAKDQLGDLNNRLAKRANQRMRDIESKGLEGTAAYNRAKNYLDTFDNGGFTKQEYFSQSRKLDIDTAYKNIEEVSKYLRWQTSTAAGEIKRRDQIVDSLMQNEELKSTFADLGEDAAEIKQGLLDFFDTDAWADIRKNNKGGTDPVVAKAIEAIEHGALLGDLTRAFKDFQLKKVDTDQIEMFNEWASAKTYYREGEWHQLKGGYRKK